jgi:undecaprenyl phosphate-alpha-L-ara4N flippase subunit ArnE
MNAVLAVLIAALSTGIGAFGVVLVKIGTRHVQLSPISTRIIVQLCNRRFILGGALLAGSTIIYLYLLRQLPLSVAYPLSSLSYIWIAIFSVKLLDERVSARRITGIVLILIGTYTLSFAIPR